MRKPVLFSLLLIWGGLAFGQEIENIDSLSKILGSDRHDSAKVQAYVELSLIYRSVGKLDSAVFFARKGYELSKKTGYPRGEAKSLYYIGIVSSIKGDYEDAGKKYTEASLIFKKIGDKKNYSSLLTALGGLRYYAGDYPGALEYHLNALKIKEEIGDSASMAATLSNIGNVYSVTGEHEKALTWLFKGLALNLKYRMYRKAVDGYYNIGHSYYYLDKDSLAVLYLERSAHLADSLGAIESLEYAYGMLGVVNSEQGKKAVALEYYLKALKIAEGLGDKRMIGVQSENIGSLYGKMGQYGQAEKYLLRALQLGEEIKETEVTLNAHNSLSLFYEQTGKHKLALFHYKVADSLSDELRNEEKAKEMTRKEMEFEFKKQHELDELEKEKTRLLNDEAQKKQRVIIWSVSVLLVLVVIFAFFLYNRFAVTNRQKTIISNQKAEVEQQRDQVSMQSKIIYEKNKEITDSINYAQRIQQAMLPGISMFDKLLDDCFVFFSPKDIVSGDFYWISETEKYIYFVAADCTGHGVPGGFMSMLGTSLLNEVVNEKKVTEPADILDMLKVKVISALKQSGQEGENKDGMDMVLCRMNKRRSELVFAAANNPLWLLRNGGIKEFKADKQPVGINPGESRQFHQHAIPLLKGDIIYIFTDGYADQFGGPGGKKFKYKQLQEMLLKNSGSPMQEQKRLLESNFVGWKGMLEQVDDVLVIGVRV